jgi:hypothetical protein
VDETPNRRAKYVGRVREDTQRIVKELMQENEKLRAIASSMERDNAALEQQLAALNAEVERQRREKSSLSEQLAVIEQDSRKLAVEFADLEHRSADLANLYVSSYQLHGTLDREAVLCAIREILINLVGSEHFAVYEMAEDESALEMVTSFGLEEESNRRISVTAHPIGRLVASGETHLAGRSPALTDLPPLVVSLPLKLDGRVTGAIVIFGLLSHKSDLQELDFELFDLLSSHAATALYCTGIQARLAAGAVA